MHASPNSRIAGFCRQYKPDILFVAGILILVTVLMGLMLNRFLTVVNHDSAIFCILAQSILKGHYLLASEPQPQPYFTFPPLLSLQMAGLMVLFGNSDPMAMQTVFKGYINLLFLISIPVFYAWIRQMLGRGPAMVLTALLAVNPVIYKYSADILSDVPFWAMSMVAIYAAWRFHRQYRSGEGPPSRWYLLAVIMIILCGLTRQIGLALILAFLVSLALQRQWKLALLSVVLFAITVGGWQSYEHFYRSQHRSGIDSLNQQGVQAVLDKSPIKLEYVKHFLIDKPVNKDENRPQTSPTVLLENAAERLTRYTRHSLTQLLPKMTVKLSGDKTNLAHFWLFGLVFWGLLLLGLRSFYRVFPFVVLYLGLYMGVLLLYPYVSIRFLLPVFPLILVCTFLGLLSARQWLAEIGPAVRKAAVAAVPVFLLLALGAALPDTIRYVNAGYKLKKADQGPSLRKRNKAYYETLLWIRDHTPENSLIIARKSPVTYYYSGRKSTAFPFTKDADSLFQYVEEKRTRYGKRLSHIYVFEDAAFSESTRYLKPAVEKHRNRLTLVHTEPATGGRVWLLK